jgi:hypothetical protein
MEGIARICLEGLRRTIESIKIAGVPAKIRNEHPPKQSQEAGFEVLRAVFMKSTIFWDITPYSLLKVNRHFGGKYLIQLHGRIR